MKQFIALCLLASLTGCSAVDTSPIGGGLAVIGLAVIVASIISALVGGGGDK